MARLATRGWQDTTALLQKHQAEVDALPDLVKRSSVQAVVTDQHRSVVAEWMVEVSCERVRQASNVSFMIGIRQPSISKPNQLDICRF